MNNNEAFNNWFDDFHIEEHPNYQQLRDFAFAGWQAAIAYMQERDKLVNEPVAYMNDSGFAYAEFKDDLDEYYGKPIPLYTTPQRVEASSTGVATLRPIDIEKLAEEHLTPFARTGWTAYGEQLKNFAKALLEDKEREIAEVKKRVHEIALDWQVSKAHINDLREALEENHYSNSTEKAINLYKRAISKTPAQSLQEFENEVIERCAKVCEKVDETTTECPELAIYCADGIRALKVCND